MTRYLSLASIGSAALSLVFTLSVFAQTAATGTIVGTVTDKTGAALAGAEVELTDKATNRVTKVTADDDGRYIFVSVLPGYYALAGVKEGFRKTSVAGLKVEAPKSYTINISLDAGEPQQTVELAAPAKAELQTGDSTVGNVTGRYLTMLPAFTRQANEFFRYQPLVTPDGAVAGARQDQSSFFLDGIDVTNNSVGGLDTFMRLPIESVEEFHVGVANPNALFGRGAGGQVSVTSRRGGSNFHGAAYYYHQNDNLNAATWTNKRTLGQNISDPVARHRIQEPEFKDNLFGVNFGGPYPWYENLYLFLSHERRRLPRVREFTRLVPTDTLKQGVLRFRDGAGNIVDYNLASATLCGAGTDAAPATGACDPRALGLSPAISRLWSALPTGNDPSLGDGLNTIGYRGVAGSPDYNGSLYNEYYSARFDYDGARRWRFDGSFRYFGEKNPGVDQLSIIGGINASQESFPIRQNMFKVGVTGQLTNNLIGEFAYGWVRSRSSTNRLSPFASAALLALPATDVFGGNVAFFAGNVALDLAPLDEPIDIGAQVAGSQANDNKNHQLNADYNWLKGSHTVQFGSHLRYLRASHLRDSKEGGVLNSLVAQLGGAQIPASVRPPLCNGATTVNCLRPGDAQQWNLLYASALGLVDNISALAVSDEHGAALPIGVPLFTNTRMWAPEFYFQDVWRARPSLTLTYGLNYGWQTSPKAKLGRATILIDDDTLKPQTALEYLGARDQAARRGEIFNPTISFQPVNDAKRDLYDIDWNNVGPRAAIAWNPNFSGGFLGALFGDGKTVIRGGFGIYYDRFNTAQSVILTTMGAGFSQSVNLTASPVCNATGAGGTGCNPNGANVALNGFRIGVDGTPPLPALPEQSPFKPIYGKLRPGANPATADPNTDVILFPERLSFQVDPGIEVAENQAFDFTWQRALPGNMVFEGGYVGRYAKKLAQNMSLNQVPFQFLDTASNQTFAQAFDALAAQLRSGTPAANVTQQAWFENQLRGTPICNSAGANNCTAGLAAAQSSSIINGNISNVFVTIDRNRIARGLQPFNNYLARTLILRSGTGRSNYNAVFATLRKRFSQGLVFTGNYTISRSLDQLGAIQSLTAATPNSFDLDAEYGPSPFDIRHQFNATGLWELPFGKGRQFDLSGALDKMFGGWYSSWIFTLQSGEPLIVTQGPGVCAWGGSFDLCGASGAIPTTDPSSFGASVNKGVNVSGIIGSNGNSGSQINLFDNPEQVFNSFRRLEISRDGRSGRANPLRGAPRWNLDMSLGKKTTIMENKTLAFALDFFNVFNHVNFANPTLDLSNPAAFGVITEQFTPPNRVAGSRWIQAGLRLEF